MFKTRSRDLEKDVERPLIPKGSKALDDNYFVLVTQTFAIISSDVWWFHRGPQNRKWKLHRLQTGNVRPHSAIIIFVD